MPQHIFTGEGEPTSVQPNNPGDHYIDQAEVPPATYLAVTDGVVLFWMRVAPSNVGTGAPSGTPAAGALYVSREGSSDRRVAVGDGAEWTWLASMKVRDTPPGSAWNEVPGLYLDNLAGNLYVSDGEGNWFSVPVTPVV